MRLGPILADAQGRTLCQFLPEKVGKTQGGTTNPQRSKT